MEEWPLGQPKLVATSARSHHRKVWPSDTSGKLGLASGGVGCLLVQLCQSLCHWLWSLHTLPGVCSPLFSPSCFNEVMFLDPLCYLNFYRVQFSAALRFIQFRVVQSQGACSPIQFYEAKLYATSRLIEFCKVQFSVTSCLIQF